MAVQAQRYGAMGAVGAELAHLVHSGRCGLGKVAALAVEAARFDHAQCVGGRHAAFDDEVEQGAGLGVQHGGSRGLWAQFRCVGAKMPP